MKPELNFLYTHAEQIGYGYHGIQTHKGLEAIGVDVYDALPGVSYATEGGRREGLCKNLLLLTVASLVAGWYEGQRTHLFTMWEATALPESLRDTLHHYDTVLTPSQDCVELFSEYHDNVHMVPLGVDGARWQFRERRTDDIFFNFLIGGSGLRKGLDLAHRAFRDLFADYKPDWGPIPRLIMKNPKGENYGGKNVEVISGYLSPEDEVELYASAHCYLQPSRGEGWGLQPLQAMAQGCPTILTDAHGHRAFARYGIPLDTTLVSANKYMSMFGESGDWWEPNYEQLRDAMWHVYSNYEGVRSVARINSEKVRTIFTWERSAQRIVEVIGLDSLTEPMTGTPKFFEPERKLYRTVTLRDWRADIGGVLHVMEKGKEYWKSADVKRILFEGGVLDPTCKDATDGLTPEQLERMGVYIEEYLRCPTCGHALDNTLDDSPELVEV